MTDAQTFDCFLSHNSRDKPAVRALVETLRGRGISVWLDEEQLRPGLPWLDEVELGIRASQSVAVLVGADGLGPWERREMRAALTLAVNDGRPVIPVLLAEAPRAPALPMFLGDRTWVDLRTCVGADGSAGIDRLVFGITGRRVDRPTPPPPTRQVSTWARTGPGLAAVGIAVWTLLRVPDPGPPIVKKPMPDWSGPPKVISHPLTSGGQGPAMIALPAGCFMMGSPPDEVGREADEGPQHSVCVDAFAIGRTEVTFAQYDRFAAATKRRMPEDAGWGRGDRPVINVSWDDAVAYTEWLSGETGHSYRLPTEAEWEYAARAGTTSPFWSGDCIHTDQANYNGTVDYADCGAKTGLFRGQTVPAGSLPPNPWGLHEVAGNVWEWCLDGYSKDFYARCQAQGQVANPLAPAAGGSPRVLRGGSFWFRPWYLRASDRDRGRPVNRNMYVGFRCVLGAPRQPFPSTH